MFWNDGTRKQSGFGNGQTRKPQEEDDFPHGNAHLRRDMCTEKWEISSDLAPDYSASRLTEPICRRKRSVDHLIDLYLKWRAKFESTFMNMLIGRRYPIWWSRWEGQEGSPKKEMWVGWMTSMAVIAERNYRKTFFRRHERVMWGILMAFRVRATRSKDHGIETKSS